MSAPDRIEEYRRLVGEDPAFQRRVWTVQRWGWVAIGGFVLLALAGGLGDGPLASAEAASADGTLRVRHDAVVRQDNATRWRISLPPGEAAVSIASDDLDRFAVLAIEPTPLSQARSGGVLTMRFSAPPRGATVAVIAIEPDQPGVLAVAVTAGAAEARFRLLVLP